MGLLSRLGILPKVTSAPDAYVLAAPLMEAISDEIGAYSVEKL